MKRFLKIKAVRSILTLLFLFFFHMPLTHGLSFGPVQIGEKRLPLTVDNFEVKIRLNEGRPVKAFLMGDTLQWIREQNVLLSPRMMVKVVVKGDAGSFYLRYQDKPVLFQKVKDVGGVAQFFIPLFAYSPIEIIEKGNKIGEIWVLAKRQENKGKSLHLIDYSCAPYNISISGLDDEYISMGCYLNRYGKLGKEKGLLEIFWTAPNLSLQGGEKPPFLMALEKDRPVEIQVVDPDKRKKIIRFEADIPSRYKRLKTAFGFGPYQFRTQDGVTDREKATSPLMFYAKWEFTPETSFRFFDAFFYQKSIFHNVGAYFAYDVGSALDGRLVVTPLLGLQGVQFKHAGVQQDFFEVLFPQGFEFTFKHAFGKENYHFIYGMFFSPSKDEHYKNIWVRYGKRLFWELNFLSWRKGDRYAKAWGLSLGIPIGSFF